MNDTQFKKGILPLCVLAMLEAEDAYGYDIAVRISEAFEVKAGTIYLVLNRLKDAGYVSSYLSDQEKGPVRRYYRMTRAGRTYFSRLNEDWNTFSASVDRLLERSRK